MLYFCKVCNNTFNNDEINFDTIKVICGCCNSSSIVKVDDLDILSIKNRKLIFLVGGTGSGKNYILSKLNDYTINVPSVTTRLKREGEIEGKDYVFISENEFNDMDTGGALCEKIKFGKYYYGVSEDILLDKLFNSILNPSLVVEPNGLKQMINWCVKNAGILNLLNIKIEIVYLNISRFIRFHNLLGEQFGTNLNGVEHLGVVYRKILESETMSLDDFAMIEKFEKNVLDRLVRNGDQINTEMEHYLEDLDLHKLRKYFPIELKHLRSFESINEYIKDFKIDPEILELIEKIDINLIEPIIQKLNNRLKGGMESGD